MKTKLCFSIILLSLFFSVYEKGNAQSPDWQWAKSTGGAGDDHGYAIAIDSSGNVYTTGSFSGTIDFDPGAGTFYLTAFGTTGDPDIFISKLDSLGNFVWAKGMGGTGNDVGHSIAVDDSGNVFTTGSFRGTAYFNTGAGTINLTSAGSDDIFICKSDASGNFVWAKAIGGTTTDQGYSIAIDASGSVYTTGWFRGTVDFDPGSSGTFNLTSAGGYDIFISKLDSSGNFVWAKAIGGTSFEQGCSIFIDVSGNVYTTGYFSGTVDFDPDSSLSFNLTSPAGGFKTFISKLSGSGNFIWAKAIGGIGFNNGTFSISVDASGNVYTTGYFHGTSDFDPDSSVNFNLTSAGGDDIFISKLDSSGNFSWAKAMGGAQSDDGKSITVDASGNIYTTGYFYGTVDFDPGAGTFNLISNGLDNIFISKLDGSGNFVWAKAIGGTNSDVGCSIAINGSGDVYLTGDFLSSSIAFGTTTLTNPFLSTNADIFIARLDTTLVTGKDDASTSHYMTSIYPNPATNQLSVSSRQAVINSIEIYDVLGQKIYSEQLKTINRKPETIIDVSKFHEGIYLVQIKSENFIETKKLIVEK